MAEPEVQRAQPDGEKRGFVFPAGSSRLRAKLQSWIRQETPGEGGEDGPPWLRVFALFYCDDICIMAESREALQDLLAVTVEFMGMMGIKLNAEKSYYTRWDPSDDPAGPT